MTHENLPQPQARSLWKKVVVLTILIATAIIGYTQFSQNVSLSTLAEHEVKLRQIQKTHAFWVYGGAFLLYVAVTGLSLPGAIPLSLLYGWFFGFWPAVLLISFASTFGATLAFLLSRFLLRDILERHFGKRLTSFNRALQRDGAFYLFTLRLIPPVPFFLINLLMGLTPLPTWTFWWVSQLGMFPGTCVYVYTASSIPDLQTIAQRGTESIVSQKLLFSLVLLGIFPLLVKRFLGRFRLTVSEEQAAEVP